MRRRERWIKVAVAAACISVGVLVWVAAESTRGVVSKDAEFLRGRYFWARGVVLAIFDGVRGHDEIKTAGLPVPWSYEYESLMSERYDVKFRAVAGCAVSLDQIEFLGGYNSMSRLFLEWKHSKDIFRECAEEAQRRYNEKNAPHLDIPQMSPWILRDG